MSQPPARPMPRWSIAGQASEVPASIAGLPAWGACVSVGPPLLDSAPSSGSTPCLLPVSRKRQVESLERLLAETMAGMPAQFAEPAAPLLLATIVFLRLVARVPSVGPVAK